MTGFRTTQPSSILRFEEAIAEAAAQWGRRLERSADPVRRAADGLLLRLGFDPAKARAGGPLDAAAQAALRRENDRLRRQAERGDARYDMNRHIAVMRLLRGDEPALREPAYREARQSGAALNRRFRRAAP